MTSKIIEAIEKENLKTDLPKLQIGDSVTLFKTIIEGKKQRSQRLEGTIVRMKGSNTRKSITLRKIIDGVGVEHTFQVNSPLVTKISVTQRSKVRRAKLYYLRKRVGAKANRLKAAE